MMTMIPPLSIPLTAIPLVGEPLMAAIPFPEIPAVIFSIGFFHLRWYALAYIMGVLLGWWILRRVTKPISDPVGGGPIDDLINYGIIGIILGGRLVYVFGYNADYYLANPFDIIKIWEGGMAFHGGFLGMIGAIIFTARRHNISPIQLGDLIAMVAPIGLFFGRLSNFINGELYGRVTDVPWGVVFPGGGELPRHPSQIYEALLEGALLFAVLTIAYRLGARQKQGLMGGLFLSGYGASRIVVELFRQPDEQVGFLFTSLTSGGITMGQLLSLPMVIIGAWFIIRAFHTTRRPAA